MLMCGRQPNICRWRAPSGSALFAHHRYRYFDWGRKMSTLIKLALLYVFTLFALAVFASTSPASADVGNGTCSTKVKCTVAEAACIASLGGDATDCITYWACCHSSPASTGGLSTCSNGAS